MLPDFLVDQHLRTGELVNLMPEWSLPAGGIFVVYPALRFRPPKVSAFTSMLTKRIQTIDGRATVDAQAPRRHAPRHP